MSCHKDSSPVAAAAAATKILTTPTRRAVGYLKGTWRRVTSKATTFIPAAATDDGRRHNLHISASFSTRRRSGACIDRTQLNDVVDDNELTIIPSNVSHGTSNSSSSTTYNHHGPPPPTPERHQQPSPAIQDADWRHFTETPMKSSPSAFLGAWSRAPPLRHPSFSQADGQTLDDSSSAFTNPCCSSISSMIEDDCVDDQHYTICEASEIKLMPVGAAARCATTTTALVPTPIVQRQLHKQDNSFLQYRHDVSEETNGDISTRSTSSSRLTIAATPTPVVRTSLARQLLLRRRDSDSIMGEDATTTINISLVVEDNDDGDIRMQDQSTDNDHDRDDHNNEPDVVSSRAAANTTTSEEGRWSFISVRGESTTNDLLQYDTADLPANKRRKVLSPDDSEEDDGAAMSRVVIKRNDGRQSRESPIFSSLPPPPPQQWQQQKSQQQGQPGVASRCHPRYSGSYSVDANSRRLVNTPLGRAVFMSRAHSVRAP